MSKVFSKFDLPKAKPSEPGNRMRDTYKWVKAEDGTEHLKRDADIDRQAEIESYADECDIKNIVARASFDPAFAQSLAQGANTGEYTDITDYPENIHELKHRADEAGKTIEKINEELKAKKTMQNDENNESNKDRSEESNQQNDKRKDE